MLAPTHFSCHTGTMDCVYSDDAGVTWSAPATIPMKRSPYDNPDASVPSNWIVWQKPILDLQGPLVYRFHPLGQPGGAYAAAQRFVDKPRVGYRVHALRKC